MRGETTGNKIFNADTVIDPLTSNTNHILKQMREKNLQGKSSTGLGNNFPSGGSKNDRKSWELFGNSLQDSDVASGKTPSNLKSTAYTLN